MRLVCMSFILTKWYVNEEWTWFERGMEFGFILTKWYVNF